MAGTFPGLVGTQQSDLNGRPLKGGKLSVMDATTNDLVIVYSDYALTQQAQNPVSTDMGGRLPIVYVPDGMYRLRLVDAKGVTSNGGYDYPQVPSIGQQLSQSTSTIDPNSVANTGSATWRIDSSQISGWVRLNGLTIGNTYSGASERANSDCQNLFGYAWNTFGNDLVPVQGGRGASANADWSANKQLVLPSMRGRTAIGADGMGNTLAGVLTSASIISPDRPGSYAGQESVTLTENQMPAHNHGGQTGGQSNDHTHGYQQAEATTSNPYVVGGAFVPFHDNASATTGGTSADHHHGISSDGGGQSHLNTPPFMIVTFYWKL